MTKLKNQIVTKLENSNFDKTKKKLGRNSKTPIVTKLKLWQNSKCDKTKNSNGDKTQKLKL